MHDLIERQAAIEAVLNLNVENRVSWRDAVIDTIDAVPSEQPEPLDEWCTDCKEYDHERHCCPRWNRVIRQTLKDAQPKIVRCKDCKYWIAHDKRCVYLNHGFAPNMWCCHGERRTDA